MTFSLEKFLLAAVVFSLVMVGGLLIITDTIANYDLSINTSEFNETFNKINQTYDLSQDMKGDMLDSEIKGGDESWESSVKNSYSTVRRIRDTFSMVGTVLSETAKVVGIPRFIITLALTALTILIVFGLIFLILGRRQA